DHQGGGPAGPGPGEEGGHRPPVPSQPVPVEHRRGGPALPKGVDPRDELGTARAPHPGPVPGGRAELHEGAGASDLRRGPGAGDPEGDDRMSDVEHEQSAGNGGEGQGPRGAPTRKDFTSDQEVRWCPGCGDYAILATVQAFMPELGITPDNTVFVSGIGCSGRFTYYMDTYGVHGIHGRAPALATGIATARPDLSVWVITGDGDGLSVGGNHLIHALRRNVNLKILLFNNQIYGLTKGQYSPTSEEGKVTKTTPFAPGPPPFNPAGLGLGAEASLVARTMDNDRQHLTKVLRQAAAHRGSAFVEIYQNCNVFNDGAFYLPPEKAQGAQN